MIEKKVPATGPFSSVTAGRGGGRGDTGELKADDSGRHPTMTGQPYKIHIEPPLSSANSLFSENNSRRTQSRRALGLGKCDRCGLY